MRLLPLIGRCLATAVLCGCQVVSGYEDFTEASAKPDDNQTERSPCTEQAAPQMGSPLLATPRVDGSCFWMDEHEVTQGQYAEFVVANPGPLGLPCSWNTEYQDAECESASERLTRDDEHPQVCVDQCDAEAYCQWAGKTLCRSSYTGAEKRDDWGAACSNAGETALPYGKTGDLETCNVLERDEGTTSNVGKNTACENDAGIRDLIGNVAEWTGGDDACATNADADDTCLIRGGSFADGFQNANCRTSTNPKRSATFDTVGFRCCLYESP